MVKLKFSLVNLITLYLITLVVFFGLLMLGCNVIVAWIGSIIASIFWPHRPWTVEKEK